MDRRLRVKGLLQGSPLAARQYAASLGTTDMVLEVRVPSFDGWFSTPVSTFEDLDSVAELLVADVTTRFQAIGLGVE